MFKDKRWGLVLPVVIWGISVLFYFHQYFLRMSISGMETRLVPLFHISAIEISFIGAAFYYSYIVMQIPAGFLMDRYGPRLMIPCASLVVGIGCLVFWHATKADDLGLARIFMGIGASFSFIGVLTLARRWFSEQSFPLINGLTTFVGSAGCALAGEPLAQLLNKYTWQETMLFAAVMSFVIMFLSYTLVRNAPPEKLHLIENTSLWQVIHAFKYVVKNIQVWLASVYIGCLYQLIIVFTAFWSTPFFEKYYPHSQLIYYAPVLTYIAYGLSSIIFGVLAEHSYHLKRLMLIGAVGTTLSLFCIITLSPSVIFMLFLNFMLGLMAGSASLAFVLTRKTTDPHIAATAFSFTNLFSILIGAILLPAFGYILELSGKAPSLSNGLDLQHFNGYHNALWLLLFVTALAVIAAFFVKDTYRMKPL